MKPKFGGIQSGLSTNALSQPQPKWSQQHQHQQQLQQMQYGQEQGLEEGDLEIDLDQITDSMIMQEDIDENYEPTQEEVLEYARFLGMNMTKDKDLFYIAREGLKAPLPEPWRPVKHPSGEMFYLNLENREVSWDHPCDSYYQEQFRKEQEKRALKQSQQMMKQYQAMEDEFTSKTVAAVTGKPKKSALPGLFKPNDIFSKKNDPLIKMTHEKKLNEYRSSQKQKLEDRKSEVDEIYKKKFKALEDQQKTKLEKIKEDYEKQKADEEEQLREKLASLENDEESDGMNVELDRYEAEIRAELKKTNRVRLEAEKKDFDSRLSSYKQNLSQQYEDQLRKRKEEIRQQCEKKIKDMEREEAELKNENRQVEFNEQEELESMKRNFANELEEKYTREREAIKRKHQDALRSFKEGEMEKHRRKLDELYASVARETQTKDEFDEEAYRSQLEEDLQDKLKSLQSELDTKYELEKLNVHQKAKEYEMKRKQEFEKSLEAEVRLIESQWTREKEKKEQEFSLQKQKIEQKAQDEFLSFKAQFEKQVNLEEKVGQQIKLDDADILGVKRIRDLFNSEQQMKIEQEKTSTDIIQKLQSELQELSEQCERMKRENEESKERQKRVRDEVDGKKRFIELSEKERQLLTEIQDKDKAIGQLRQQIDELDEKDIHIELDDMYSQMKLHPLPGAGATSALLQNNSHLNQQIPPVEFEDLDSGYTSDSSAVNFNQNLNLKQALSQVSSEIDKEKLKLHEDRNKVVSDLATLGKELAAAEITQQSEKKQFLLNMRSMLEEKQHKIEKKIKALMKMNGVMPKGLPKQSGLVQGKQHENQQAATFEENNERVSRQPLASAVVDTSSKFLQDYQQFLSKYQQKS